MKLLYDLPPKSRVALEMQFSDDERIMYCLPYNIEGKRFVSDGYTVITDECIYKVLGDEIIYRREIDKMSDFGTETHYGSCAFYAKYEGSTELICRFITARHMPRYTVIAKACELLAEKKINISQIAYIVGFSSQTHFSTAFRKFYGISPTEYIKNQ